MARSQHQVTRRNETLRLRGGVTQQLIAARTVERRPADPDVCHSSRGGGPATDLGNQG